MKPKSYFLLLSSECLPQSFSGHLKSLTQSCPLKSVTHQCVPGGSGGFPGGSDGKTSACSAEDPGSIPGSGRSPGEGNGNPLQYSCLENSMDGGAWWATVHGVAKSWTQLSDFTFRCVPAPGHQGATPIC